MFKYTFNHNLNCIGAHEDNCENEIEFQLVKEPSSATVAPLLISTNPPYRSLTMQPTEGVHKPGLLVFFLLPCTSPVEMEPPWNEQKKLKKVETVFGLSDFSRVFFFGFFVKRVCSDFFVYLFIYFAEKISCWINKIKLGHLTRKIKVPTFLSRNPLFPYKALSVFDPQEGHDLKSPEQQSLCP